MLPLAGRWARRSSPAARALVSSAHLWPRSRLILDWTDEAKSGFPPPPLLAAQVEIAIDADLEAVTTRSSWVIRCVRGIARRLEIRLDELDVVQTLKLDDQFLVAAIERNVLTIPLGEAMRPGETRHLVMETRRTFPPNAPKTYAFSGFPLSNAVEQSGAIGITQSANLWINVTTAQGLHRIDPRELPTELRARPGTGTAYQFLDQPYKLGLGIENSPPLYRSETSTRMVLDAQTAQVDTTVQVQRVRGRLFEIEIVVPAGLQMISVGPADLVESAIPIVAQTLATGSDRPRETAQVLKIHLTPLGRDRKSFFLRLRGQQRIGPEGSGEARSIRHPRRSLHRQHRFPIRRPRGDLRARRRARTAGRVKRWRVPTSASRGVIGG